MRNPDKRNNRRNGGRLRGVKILVKALVWLAVLAAVVWLVMALWNWLMPALFAGARPIDYWQALGLLALSKILFGHGHGRWHGHRHWHRMNRRERAEFGRRFARCEHDDTTPPANQDERTTR